MDMNTKRPYAMTKRAAGAEETRREILRAGFELSGEKLSTDIVLADVAERSGVTVKTILRHFGSREGLFDSVIAFARQEIVDERATPVGDIDEAVAVIHAHYELRGDWVLRLLSQEAADERIRDIVETGRTVHREWVRAAFSPQLEQTPAALLESTIDLLVVATDLYTWKLLRRDRDLGRAETQDRVRTLVRAVLKHNSERN
jgi:AcrR family transcriptional regulator